LCRRPELTTDPESLIEIQREIDWDNEANDFYPEVSDDDNFDVTEFLDYHLERDEVVEGAH
jgi:hypothetical protein